MGMSNFLKFLFVIPLFITICSCEKKGGYYISKLQTEGNLILAETYIQSYFERGWTLGPDRKGVWLTGHYIKWAEVDFRKIKVEIDKKNKTFTYTLPKITFKSGYDTDGIRKIYGSITVGPDFYTTEGSKIHTKAVKKIETEYIDNKGRYFNEIENELIETAINSAETYLREFTKKIVKDDIAVYVKFKEQ